MKTKVKKVTPKKAVKKVAVKTSKEKEVKKSPMTLFGMEIKHNPKAHKFSVAMAMVGLTTDIQSADLILRLFDVIDEMGGKFDISTAVDLRLEVTNEYDAIKEEFENIKTNKSKST
jgi:hypothetical protein